MPHRVATGFDFEPLPDGNIRIEFQDDDGKSFNTQFMTRDAFIRIPLVAFITLMAMGQGKEVAEKLVGIMRTAEEAEDRSHE